ncbi:hypothetical protein E2C01_101639 [Portunus trituberculatus]|uniref:Uncharacterized protein n=1 Tax=Portunus trituberculatus TaxID=210409 RepID=A0A5B7KKW3_PORTR|nr:hypothetical protein [Portunus trituberculatus]
MDGRGSCVRAKERLKEGGCTRRGTSGAETAAVPSLPHHLEAWVAEEITILRKDIKWKSVAKVTAGATAEDREGVGVGAGVGVEMELKARVGDIARDEAQVEGRCVAGRGKAKCGEEEQKRFL